MYDLYRPPLLCLADSSEHVSARQLYFYSQEEEKREGDSSVQQYRTSLIRIVISDVGWNIFALPGSVNSAFFSHTPVSLFFHTLSSPCFSPLFSLFLPTFHLFFSLILALGH